MSHITYLEAAVVGLVQGVTELFPVSSLGHNVLIPALIGGSWASDLNVAKPESPYLAFIVGLHVATALALLIYFWRDWIRIIGGFFTSLRLRPGWPWVRLDTRDQKLAWMIILATIPVGIVGLLAEHAFRVIFGRPIVAGFFLIVNGVILYCGERFRTRQSVQADQAAAAERERGAAAVARSVTGAPGPGQPRLRGHQAVRQEEIALAMRADERLAQVGYGRRSSSAQRRSWPCWPGSAGTASPWSAGMARGLSREDAARFAFLLATPVILAAGVLKVPDLTGPLGNGIHGQILLGSALSFVGAYVSVRFLMKYFQTRTLTPFAIYCFVVGLGSVIYLGLIK